jgi:hypothetical protein
VGAVKNLKIVMDQKLNRIAKFAFLLLLSSKLIGQTEATIKIYEDQAVTRAMAHYKKVNKSITHISGWRITVITTADRRQVEEAKLNFQKGYNYRIKTEYKEPYYHLKAGAFITRNDATWALENIKKKFPSAFLSVDKIAYDEL